MKNTPDSEKSKKPEDATQKKAEDVGKDKQEKTEEAPVLALIERISDEGLFRADADVEVDVLARSLWVLSRSWMEHLREMEQRETLDDHDVQRGIDHHFAVLLPTLTADGRRRFRSARDRARS